MTDPNTPMVRCLVAEGDLVTETYQRYNDSGDPESRWKTYSGGDVPRLRDVGENVQAKWRAAAEYAYERGCRDGIAAEQSRKGHHSRGDIVETLRSMTNLDENTIQAVAGHLFCDSGEPIPT